MSVTTNLGLVKLDQVNIDTGDFFGTLKTGYNANLAKLDTTTAAISVSANSVSLGFVPFTTKGALATLTVANNAVECTGTTAFTMYLPAACPAGKLFQIFNSSSANVTLSGNDTTINGAATLLISSSVGKSVLKGTSVYIAY